MFSFVLGARRARSPNEFTWDLLFVYFVIWFIRAACLHSTMCNQFDWLLLRALTRAALTNPFLCFVKLQITWIWLERRRGPRATLRIEESNPNAASIFINKIKIRWRSKFKKWTLQERSCANRERTKTCFSSPSLSLFLWCDAPPSASANPHLCTFIKTLFCSLSRFARRGWMLPTGLGFGWIHFPFCNASSFVTHYIVAKASPLCASRRS